MKRTNAANKSAKAGGKMRTTISISQVALDSGTARAGEEDRNFSNYLEWLIKRDVKAGQSKGAKRA